MQDRYIIQTLDQDRFEAAANFTGAAFARGSELHQALGIDAERYLQDTRESLLALMCEDLSLIALDTTDGSIVGSILAGDFQKTVENPANPPDYLRPIEALLEQLVQGYKASREPKPGTTALVDIAVVSETARGQGIYAQLRRAVQVRARQRGYKTVLGELSSAYTQKYCVEKLGHSVMNEITYTDFEFAGRSPFASIRSPSGIQLVEGNL